MIGVQQLKARTASGGQTLGASATNILWLETGAGGSAKAYIDLEPKRIQTLTVRIAVATANVTALRVLAKIHPDDTVWVPLAADAADYTGSPLGFIRYAEVFTALDAKVDKDARTIDATQYAVLVIACTGFAQLAIELTGNTAVINAFASGFSD